MIVRLHSLFVRYDTDQERALRKVIQKRLGQHWRDISRYEITRRSIDARHRPVRFVYTVDLYLKADADPSLPGTVPAPPVVPMTVEPGVRPLDEAPVVVGGGPAGLFAALLLAEHGYRPRLLERGGSVAERIDALKAFADTRVPNPENNALFGIGGAGTFSDGKLRTGVNHPWLPEVMRVLTECGAPKQICIDAKPHVGTDILVTVLDSLVRRIEAAGGTVETGVRMNQLRVQGGRLSGLETSAGPVTCTATILAIGHSARDTWHALTQAGVRLEPKPFQLGVRVEHPQAWIDEKRYGNAAGDPRLGAADYKLATKVDGVPVFSFCMCPGGETMATVSEPSRLAINGMSLSRRASPFASSGLVVTLTPASYGGGDLDSALAFQREIEARCFEAGGRDYSAPAQRLVDFAAGVASSKLPATSYALGTVAARLDTILPDIVAAPLQRALGDFDRKLTGYLHPDALALAPESRASSPIRIVRDPNRLETPDVEGVFPVGEGAGYAGGITSAALDGLNAAKQIIERFAPSR